MLENIEIIGKKERYNKNKKGELIMQKICDKNFIENSMIEMEKDEKDTETSKVMSPRHFLFKCGIEIYKSSETELGEYEIRFNPLVACTFDEGSWDIADYLCAPREQRILGEYYRSVWTDDEFDYWTFSDLEPTPYFSLIVDYDNPRAECSNLEELIKGTPEGYDANDGVSEQMAIRYFYPTAESCFADFQKIFEETYMIFSSASTFKFHYESLNKITITES